MQAETSPSKRGVESDLWHPRKRLRHLHSITPKFDRQQLFQEPETTCYFALWSHCKSRDASSEATCIYVSRQVNLCNNEEWPPLGLQQSEVASEHLDGLLSGAIHLHFYALSNSDLQTVALTPQQLQQCSRWSHPSAASVKAQLQSPKLSPLHDPAASPKSSDPDSEDGSDVEMSEHRIRSGQNGLSRAPVVAKGNGHIEQDAAHFVGIRQSGKSPKAKEPVLYQLSCATRPASSITDSLELPGHLMLAVSLDLEALSRGSTEFRASSDVECSLQLIFEFVDGSMLFWPDLQPGDARGSLDLQPQQLSEQLTKQDPGIADQSEGRKPWSSLFKRTTYGSAPDLLDKEAEAALTLAELRNQSLASINGSGSELVRSKLRATTSDQESLPVEVSYCKLHSALLTLTRLQQRVGSADSLSAKSLSRLTAALEAKEKLRQCRRQIDEARAQAGVKRLQTVSTKRRLKGVQQSARAARDLMLKRGISLASSCTRLEDLWCHMEGPELGYWRELQLNWRHIHRKLVARRCRLLADVQQIYDIQPKTVAITAPQSTSKAIMAPKPPKSESVSMKEKTGAEEATLSEAETSHTDDSSSEMSQALTELSLAGSNTREIARLAIGSLSLEPYLDRQQSKDLPLLAWQSDKEKEMRLAAALGYAAHVTHHLAQYLGVPLKYPIRPSNSHSWVVNCADPVSTWTNGRESASMDGSNSAVSLPLEYRLHPDGSEQSRCAYAIFLLNKDLEQLLESHGLTSAGPSLVLQNLYKLLTAALSATASRQEWQTRRD